MPHRTKIRGEGRAHRARGGEETVLAPSGYIRRARGSWRVVLRGGAGRGGGLRATHGDPTVIARRARPWRGLKAVPPGGPASGPKRRPAASPGLDEGAPRGRETLPSSLARKGLAVLSCLVAPPATLCNRIAAIGSPGSRRPARSPALPRPAL